MNSFRGLVSVTKSFFPDEIEVFAGAYVEKNELNKDGSEIKMADFS